MRKQTQKNVVKQKSIIFYVTLIKQMFTVTCVIFHYDINKRDVEYISQGDTNKNNQKISRGLYTVLNKSHVSIQYIKF